MRAKFLNEDCQQALNNFQTKYPISMALHLKATEKYSDSEVSEMATLKEEGLLGDEADTFKMCRRMTRYLDCSRHFIRYFVEANQMVTIDVEEHCEADVWRTIVLLLSDLDFKPLLDPPTVVLFEFEEHDLLDVDLDKYVSVM
jgi:hypothetical protein